MLKSKWLWGLVGVLSDFSVQIDLAEVHEPGSRGFRILCLDYEDIAKWRQRRSMPIFLAGNCSFIGGVERQDTAGKYGPVLDQLFGQFGEAVPKSVDDQLQSV